MSQGLVPPELHRPMGPMDAEKRQRVKDNLLREMAVSNNQTMACERAGTSRATYYKWVREGFISRAEIDEAYQQYLDSIREEVRKRYMHGVRKPVMVNGRIATDAEGQPIWVEYPSDSILVKVAEHLLPEWQGNEKPDGDDVTTASGIPAKYLVALDARDLLEDELASIKNIVTAIEQRKTGVTVIDSD